MKRARLTSLIFLLLLLFVPALGASDLKAQAIYTASSSELKDMAALRGIDTSLSDEEIRNLLYEAEGVTFAEENVSSDGGEYTLQIVNADTLDVLSNGTVVLSGSAEVAFTLQDGESEKVLQASSMIVDSSASRLTAFGDVFYHDSVEREGGIGRINADIVTFIWSTGTLYVSGGTTESERTTSEDEDVTFYTTGDLISYKANESGLFFSGGYITSNPKTAYSSITAGGLAMLEGGDMFLTNAYLSIGRVPILYLPFFFFPGSRMVGNPSFGFNSNRGRFVSTTFELFGTYPETESGDVSSFSSILKTNSSEEALISNGIYYETGEPEEGIGKWAADTESYFVIMADAYETAGLALGYDTNLNLFSDSLFIDSTSMFVLSPETYRRRYRYYSLTDIDFSNSISSFTLHFPLYSDPSVYNVYSSRLTSFTPDAVLGLSQSFTTSSSTVSTYTASFSGSISIPSSWRKAWLDTLKLSSLEASALYTWSSTAYRYNVSDVTLPSFSISAGGTLYSITSNGSTTTATAEKTTTTKISYSDYFLLRDPLLYPMYSAAVLNTTTSSATYSFSLKYTISETFSSLFEVDNDLGKLEDLSLSNSTSGRLIMAAQAGQWFSLSSTLTPTYAVTYREDRDNQKITNWTVLSTNAVSIPVLGLTYNLSVELYRSKTTTYASSEGESESYLFKWNSDRVKTHNITFSKTFDIGAGGSLTPALKYTLPPLTSALEPTLTWKLGGLTVAGSWAFIKEDDESSFQSEDIDLSIGYSSDYFTFTFTSTYESDEDRTEFFDPFYFTSSASLRTKDKAYSFTEYIEYYGLLAGERNVLSSIKSTLVTPLVTFVYNAFTDDGVYTNDYFEVLSTVKDIPFYTWYNRIRFSPIFTGTFHYDFTNPYASYLSLTYGFSFRIAEFIRADLSVTSSNSSFYDYFDDNAAFSFPLLWSDLVRSFDFFGTGRYHTNFNMESVALEVIHYMSDWDLHCKYSAKIVSSNYVYTWVPEFTIYLSWKTLPDLKVDQTWTNSGSGWSQSSSST